MAPVRLAGVAEAGGARLGEQARRELLTADHHRELSMASAKSGTAASLSPSFLLFALTASV